MRKSKKISSQSVAKFSASQHSVVTTYDTIGEQDGNLSANIVLDCAKTGDLAQFVNCYEDPNSPYRDKVGGLINRRSSQDGKTPLDWASLLGKPGMVVELLKRGADINSVSSKGYAAIHLAAAWDKADCLRILIANDADIHLETANGERPYDIAVRYNQYHCYTMLECAEAREKLKEVIAAMRNDMNAPDKGKILTKEDKVAINNVIQESLDWIEKTKDATIKDYTTQENTFMKAMEPFIQKCNEPPPEKPSKK